MVDRDENGLSETEAASRLAASGYNELASAKPRNFFYIVLDVVREPMFLLLLACGSIYLALGNPREALMLLFFVFVVMTITLVQRHRAERTLDALKSLSSPRALVIRDGVQRRIPGREVVVGDYVVIAEGDRIPADGLLLQQLNLNIDESLLTGESVGVRKSAMTSAITEALPAPGGDDLSSVYASTLVTQGNGLFRVVATAGDTAIGKIGSALSSIEQQSTPIQNEVRITVKRVAIFGFILSLAIALGYGLPRGNILDGLLVGITFAMAILPEELPVVMTLFLGLGAWRLAQVKVLTRRVATIETLGTATVLCVDKTGTLTQNKMQIEQLYAYKKQSSQGKLRAIKADTRETLPEEFHELLEFSLLASHRSPFDPMEMAIHNAVAATLANTEHVHTDWELIEEYPLSKELLAMSRVWQSSQREHYAIAAKGSPEAIIDLCHLDPKHSAQIIREVTALAEQVLRVIGVAKASFKKIELPEIQHDFNFEFLGVIGLADPVRADAPAAIAECHQAGVRVVMITGDYPTTAMSIAAQIGIETGAGFIAGSELNALDEAALALRVRDVNVFCRVSPEQKLNLVKAFKNNGEIVAMTGDGVNDAPAIRAAHIGIAMGARGTDVAREAADLVLMNDDFSSIVAAIRMGRRIYDNLTKAIIFIIAVHVPIVGLSLLPLFFDWPLLLLPVHILFLQLIIDPACSIVFEAEPGEADLMQRQPRPAHTRLFNAGTLLLGLTQGLILLTVLALVYAVSTHQGYDADSARTMTYATMILANLGLIFSNLSSARWRWFPSGEKTQRATHTPTFVWISAVTVLALAGILGIPFLRELFFFARPTTLSIGITFAGCAICIAGFEVLKWWRSVIADER